eukprot:6394927-Pyramimonas_sp.AAC.1
MDEDAGRTGMSDEQWWLAPLRHVLPRHVHAEHVDPAVARARLPGARAAGAPAEGAPGVRQESGGLQG